FLPFFIGMAFISSLLGILVSLPRFLAILAGQSDKLPASALPGFFPLAVTVYALCCLIELSVIKIPVLARLLSGSGKAPERRPAAEPTPPLSRAKPAPHVRRVYRLREKTGIRMELAAYARRQVDALNLNDPAFERIAPNATSGEIPEDQFAVSAALMDEIDRIEPSEDDLAFLDQLDKWADS
ncbi:MAG TPA: hypothetical protein DEQ02_06055, partial [Ruminococcaceae bacterium]|nr:hypothetical protein [Oscillospiraceae bacterium]